MKYLGKTLIILGAGLCLSTGAMAQSQAEPEAPKVDVVKVYEEGTLTPDDIRKCLQTDLDIKDMEVKLAAYEQTLTDYRKQIADLADDLDRRRKQIDGTDPKAVDIYNKRVDRHRNMIDRYNTKFLPTLTERKTRLNSGIDTYNNDCADKSYFEEDWLAAVEEMGIEDPRPQAGGGK